MSRTTRFGVPENGGPNQAAPDRDPPNPRPARLPVSRKGLLRGASAASLLAVAATVAISTSAGSPPAVAATPAAEPLGADGPRAVALGDLLSQAAIAGAVPSPTQAPTPPPAPATPAPQPAATQPPQPAPPQPAPHTAVPAKPAPAKTTAAAAPKPVTAAPAPAPAPQAASRDYSRSGLSPMQVGQAMAAQRGWTGSQWQCLATIWTRESGWSVTAANSSGAYGIPQALPGSKMAAYGADWRTNPATQVAWGLDYIAGRYGNPCSAWAFWQGHHWY